MSAKLLLQKQMVHLPLFSAVKVNSMQGSDSAKGIGTLDFYRVLA
ncbi:hypothetical protein O59_002828 [Cellvibrio sp. BR]|nr:hypothetical protein O59_002828 [Cellvibrio sp. BR]